MEKGERGVSGLVLQYLSFALSSSSASGSSGRGNNAPTNEQSAWLQFNRSIKSVNNFKSLIISISKFVEEYPIELHSLDLKLLGKVNMKNRQT